MLLNTKGGPLYYEVIGSGPPLVFASGWAMTAECWQPAVARLKRRYTCVIYDQRGTGRSQPPTPRAGFDVDDHARDLHAVIMASGAHDAHLIGHDIGALVAAACAERHPQDARALVMVSPRAGFSEGDISKLALFTPAAIALRELAAYPVLRHLVAARFRRAPEPYRDVLFNDFAAVNPRAAYETALSAADTDALPRLERVVSRSKLSILLICGGRDRKSMDLARSLFAIANRARLATMKDSGFLPTLEYPHQFIRLIDDFVSENIATGAGALTRR